MPPPTPPPDDDDVLTVKLRNDTQYPPEAQTFLLPKSRALSTSPYLRAHVLSHSTHPNTPTSSPASSSREKKNDGIIRLNFPDFEIFELYIIWLRTGRIHSKAEQRTLCEPERTGASEISTCGDMDTVASSKEKRKRFTAAFTDALGLYFLSRWLRDTHLADSITTHIIRLSNLQISAGHPSYFVRALRPSIVDLVLTDEGESRGMRSLLYTAIAKWGTEKDMWRLVPDEGGTASRPFVRFLLGFLLGARRRNEEGGDGVEVERGSVWRNEDVGREGEDEEEDADTWTSISTATPRPTEIGLKRMPAPFGVGIEDLWMSRGEREGVDWGSSTAATEVSGATGGTARSGSATLADKERVRYVEWPRREEDYCLFHEHVRLGMPCHREREGADAELP
jgi:hypothetical protein